MIIIRIYGGLGNQMFQYAFGYAISKKLNSRLIIDALDFKNYKIRKFKLPYFPIKFEYISQEDIAIFRHENKTPIIKNIFYKFKKLILNYKYVKEPYYHFWPNYNQIKSCSYLDGYWQSEDYFIKYDKELRECFNYKNTNPAAINYLKKIQSTESVFIHIRRGDYISNEAAYKVHGICSDDYYNTAIKIIESKCSKINYFIFSDDIDFVKKNMFKYFDNKTFIELDANDDSTDIEELALMASCKHAIIANSSFSWWGAWLIDNSEKVIIAPQKWFADPAIKTDGRLPKSWIKI
jgi:hypothetical protein